jgi:hypothetical protein
MIDLYDRSVVVFLHKTQLFMAAAIVADDVVKLILPLKAEEFRCYNDYFDWMISLDIIHENKLLRINLPTGDVERNEV